MIALRRQMLDFARGVLKARTLTPKLEREGLHLVEQLTPRKRPKWRRTAPIKTDAEGYPERTARELAEQRARSAAVYEAVNARAIAAGDLCECGCGKSLVRYGREMDHWLGGNGRRKQMESVETCWMLTPACHRERQHPRTAEQVVAWNERFAAHCRKYGYGFTGHIVHQRLTRQAT